MTERVTFLVDGFNVYHAVTNCVYLNQIKNGKWFDYYRYFDWMVKNNSTFSKGSTLVDVRLYSALAHHIDAKSPGVVARHKDLLAALESTGVNVTLGRFKRKSVKCGGTCKDKYTAFEEKETDINIAMGIIESFYKDESDCAVVVSGDTDLIAGIRTARQLFPTKRVGVLWPPERHNEELRNVASFALKIKPVHFEQYQLPNPVVCANGQKISKPAGW